MTEKPAPLIPRRERISPAVEEAVLIALEKLPADRFASAAEFAAALEGEGTTRTRLLPRPMPAARVRAFWPAAAAALVVGSALGWMAHRPAVPALAPRVRVILTPDSAAPPAVHSCCASAVAISADGQRMAYASRQAGRSVVLVRDRDGFAPLLISNRDTRHPFFSPSGDSIAFTEWERVLAGAPPILARASSQGGTSSRIAMLTAPDLTGATWLPDGSIVFAQFQGSLGLLRVRDDGSGAPTVLTTPDTAAGEARHVAPHYVPEVNGILFGIWPRGDDPAQARIGLLTLDDGKVRILGRGLGPQYTRSGHLVYATPDGTVLAERVDLRSGRRSGVAHRLAEGVSVRGLWTADFAISRDGTLVFDQGHTEAAVELVGADGSRHLLPIAAEGVAHWDDPRFSPDGHRVAAAGSRSGMHQIYVLDLDRNTAERLTFEGQSEFLDWSPDGRSIVYVKSATGLAERAVDRSGDERVLWKGDGGELGRVSTNGRWIAFAHATPISGRAAGSAPGTDIYVLSRDAEAPRPWLATRFEEGSPTISPDGHWLAYVSDETGRNEVYVGAFPDASGGRQVISTDGGSEPQWSPDGRHLYYRSATSGSIMELPVLPGARFAVGPARAVLHGSEDRGSDGADWDIHPSGDRFVTVTTRAVGSRIVWILNAIPEEK